MMDDPTSSLISRAGVRPRCRISAQMSREISFSRQLSQQTMSPRRISHNLTTPWPLTSAKPLSSTWKTYPQHLPFKPHHQTLHIVTHFLLLFPHLKSAARKHGRTRHRYPPKGRRLLSRFRMSCQLLSTPMSPLLRNESIDLGNLCRRSWQASSRLCKRLIGRWATSCISPSRRRTEMGRISNALHNTQCTPPISYKDVLLILLP